MRFSSATLAAIGATLVVASPVHKNLHKKAIVWDIVTDVVYVTVTEGHLPKTSPSKHFGTTVTVKHTHWVEPAPATTSKKVAPTTTSTPPPPPPPSSSFSSTSSTSTSTSTPPPPPPAPTTTSTSTPPPPPPSTTSEASAPAPTTQESTVVTASPSPVAEVVKSSSSAATVAPPAASPTDLASTALYYHNAHRANHSASALTWDQKLADYAQITANTCVFAHDMSEGGGGYGQNIDSAGFANANDDPDGTWKAKVEAWDPSAVLANAITNDWYLGELAIFDGDNADKKVLYGLADPPQYSPEWTHFSQIVWKSSTTVGCAVKYCGSDHMLAPAYAWYTVCNYGPAGNYLGEFASEVGENLGKAPVGQRFPDGNFGVPFPSYGHMLAVDDAWT